MLKQIITWAVVILVIYAIAVHPTDAAGAVHSIYGGLHSAATSMADFVNSL